MNQEEESPLYKTLYAGLPKHQSAHRQNVLDVRKVATDLKISFQAIYRWFERGRVPPHQVKHLMNLPGSTLTKDDLIPFVIGAV